MSKLISLASPNQPVSAQAMREALSGGGCSASACGAPEGREDLPASVWERVQDHPCYSEQAHHFFARMHVAVAPACNIQCHYCNRKYDCANESRPGVVSERLSPEQALSKVVAVANRVPQLSVLGIAGPGDACYDWNKTRATFELVAAKIPDVKLCLSSNGLALPDHIDELVDMRIDHVTLTINMIDPEIGSQIYPWIFHRNRRWTGVEASRILLERQMQSLELLVAHDILVKVNSVMIPGVNDRHLIEVNHRVKQMGAFLHNIMPLISDPAHGTHYGLTGQRGPSAAELKQLQDQLEDGTRLMRHCRQCRADAVGLLGEDRGQEFTLDRLQPEELAMPVYDPSARDEYRAIVAEERGEQAEARNAVNAELAQVAMEQEALVAVATRGGGRINLHFGHVREFQIYRVSARGVDFVTHRKLAQQYCEGGDGEATALTAIVELLADIDVVLCAKIGDCPRDELARAGVTVSAAYAYEWIEAGIAAWYRETFATEVAERRIA